MRSEKKGMEGKQEEGGQQQQQEEGDGTAREDTKWLLCGRQFEVGHGNCSGICR